MKVFVGYGYNPRDEWIEERVFPILECAGLTVVHGKDLVGQDLAAGVATRIERSDAAIGFFTLRDGQGAADFNSHIWVRDEMVYAVTKNKPIIPVREAGVTLPEGLLGNRQYIPLDQNDRLACVVAVMVAIGKRNLLRVRLTPADDALRKEIWQLRNDAGFAVRFRTQNEQGDESQYQDGRLETINQGYYLNLTNVPQKGLVEVVGVLNGQERFSSGWVAADAVQITVS